MENKITQILMELGTPCQLKGYGLIKQAILMILKDDSYKNNITKALYPDLAKKNQTTASRAERAIRHAITATFNNVKPKTVEKYFGNSISVGSGKPYNSQFLVTIAERMKDME